jgi:formate/nitrite transporter FocA (FNT family)
MKQFDLFIQCIAASVLVAIAVWTTVGTPPHQGVKAQFNVASRR